MANGPAVKGGVVDRILKASELSGDPVEHSKLRREVSDILVVYLSRKLLEFDH